MTPPGVPADRIDALLEAVDPRGPGCAIGVVADGELRYARGVGLANLEYDVPITPDTPFHVASVSKQFTAAAIGLLAIRHQLDLGDDARTYLPRLPWFGSTITLQHLVHHTSGLRDQWTLLAAAGWRAADVVTSDDILELAYAQETLNFMPGTAFSYSNTGYTLLAKVVETISGVSLREFCQREFFNPLGMSGTHFHDDAASLVPGRAHSYVEKEDGSFRQAPLNFATTGATNLHSTVRDLARWEANLRHGELVGGARLLDLIHERGVELQGGASYGFGLLVDRHRGACRVGHGGADAAFTSYDVRFPDLDLAVVVLANSSRVSAPALMLQVVDACLDELGVPPVRASEAAPTTKDIAGLAGLYVDRKSGTALCLREQENHLVVVDGDDLMTLEALPGNRFRLPAGTELHFDEAADPGSVRVDSIGLMPLTLARETPVDPEAMSLDDYVGDYWSTELEVRLRVRIKSGRLALLGRKLPPIELIPTVPDMFRGKWPDAGWPVTFHVIFERSDEAVDTMLISFPRSHRIAFTTTYGVE
jgi:CubicO group peptidase (beta-lactamase class C family)